MWHRREAKPLISQEFSTQETGVLNRVAAWKKGGAFWQTAGRIATLCLPLQPVGSVGDLRIPTECADRLYAAADFSALTARRTISRFWTQRRRPTSENPTPGSQMLATRTSC